MNYLALVFQSYQFTLIFLIMNEHLKQLCVNYTYCAKHKELVHIGGESGDIEREGLEDIERGRVGRYWWKGGRWRY